MNGTEWTLVLMLVGSWIITTFWVDWLRAQQGRMLLAYIEGKKKKKGS